MQLSAISYFPETSVSESGHESRARLLLITLAAGSYPVTLLLAGLVGMKVNYSEITTAIITVVPLLLTGMILSHLFRMHLLASVFELELYGLALTLPIALSTYIAMHFNMPLADHTLLAIDRWMGFDWEPFIRTVDANAWLSYVLQQAYTSFSYQLFLLPPLLAVTGKRLRAEMMLINFALIAFASSLISIWFPALGTYTMFGIDPSSLKTINSYFGFAFLEQFDAVRNNPDFIFTPQAVRGILTFPSVHAALAALCIWAGWTTKVLRYPLLALNVLMAVSAISHANHYLVDVIAGMAVTASVIVASNWLLLRKPAIRFASNG